MTIFDVILRIALATIAACFMLTLFRLFTLAMQGR